MKPGTMEIKNSLKKAAFNEQMMKNDNDMI